MRAAAPGRVTLLGDHTDYNDGFVLPVASESRVVVWAAPREDGAACVVSEWAAEDASWPLGRWRSTEHAGWTAYPAGAAELLRAGGARLPGFDLLISGDLAPGAGLSSSAALSVAILLALAHLAGEPVATDELIDLACRLEREYVGVACGIMDPANCLMTRPHHALLLDCRTREGRNIPLPDELRLLVVDIGARRQLRDGRYAARQHECRAALQYFQRLQRDVRALRDVTPETARGHATQMPPVLAQRAIHVATENQRVLDGVAALQANNLDRLGSLMSESHRSLRDDFECSTPEIDGLVRHLLDGPGILGARQIGAGFGGAVCALLAEPSDRARVHLLSAYPAAHVWEMRGGPGAQVDDVRNPA